MEKSSTKLKRQRLWRNAWINLAIAKEPQRRQTGSNAKTLKFDYLLRQDFSYDLVSTKKMKEIAANDLTRMNEGDNFKQTG